MAHVGEIVRKAVEESGLTHTAVARKVKISRQTLYNLYDNAWLEPSLLLRIGAVVHTDFSYLLQSSDYKHHPLANVLATEKETDWRHESGYWRSKAEESTLRLAELQQRYDELNAKYIRLLEQQPSKAKK
jgi:plasmid maintenance system antidote protein VapI